MKVSEIWNLINPEKMEKIKWNGIFKTVVLLFCLILLGALFLQLSKGHEIGVFIR